MLDIPDGLRYSVKVPNLPTLIQTGLKKRSESEAAYFLGRSLLLTPSTSPRGGDYGLTFREELRGTPLLLGRLDSERFSLCNAGS